MPAEKDPETPLSETRKSSKPIMEKRRRARINASLCELKSLLLEVMKKEGTRHNKMEKADILEMTVKHLRQIQRQQFAVAAGSDPAVINRYHSGFTECANEVTRYLSSVEGVDVELRTRMLNHLANSLQGMRTPSPPPPRTPPCSAEMTAITIAPKVSPSLSPTGEVNNNTLPNVFMTTPATTNSLNPSPNKVLGGLQVIPSRLPSGEVAFVIPGNMLTNGQLPGYVIPVYTGATTMMTSAGSVSTQAPPSVPVQTVVTSGVPIATATLQSASGSSAVVPTTPVVVLPSVVPSVATATTVSTSPTATDAGKSSQSTQNEIKSTPNPVNRLKEPKPIRLEAQEIKHEVLPEQNEDNKELVLDENVWRPW